MKKREIVKVSFWGFKFECEEPTTKTLIILIMILMFLGLVFYNI